MTVYYDLCDIHISLCNMQAGTGKGKRIPCIVHLAFCLPLFRKVKKGTLLIDSSTIDPAVSKEMAVAAEKMGAVFMDAPVSGGKVT